MPETSLTNNVFWDFIFGPFVGNLPIVFLWAVVLLAIYQFLGKKILFPFRKIIIFAVAFRIFYASLLTWGQYFVWSASDFTKTFLNSPLSAALPIGLVRNFSWLFDSSLGYFFFYSWGRFWLNAILSIGLAFIFWSILVWLKKYRERFFDENEVELGLLFALISGWPNILIFVFLTFLFVVLLSVFRLLFLKEGYTTLGLPFVLAILATIIFSGPLISFFDLSVLKI